MNFLNNLFGGDCGESPILWIVIILVILGLFNNDNECNNSCDVRGANTNNCGNVLGTNTNCNNGGFEWIWILVIIFLLFGMDDNNCNQNCNPC